MVGAFFLPPCSAYPPEPLNANARCWRLKEVLGIVFGKKKKKQHPRPFKAFDDLVSRHPSSGLAALESSDAGIRRFTLRRVRAACVHLPVCHCLQVWACCLQMHANAFFFLLLSPLQVYDVFFFLHRVRYTSRVRKKKTKQWPRYH